MNKILKNLSSSGDITELTIFLDNFHPHILKESVVSQEKEQSFFLYFSYGIKHNYEKIKSFYELNKKYGYQFKNNFNKDQKEKNELKDIVQDMYCNSTFVIECLNELSREEKVAMIIDCDILYKAFKSNKIEILKELKNYPEVWKDEKRLNLIKQEHLKNLELSEIYYKNTAQDNPEEFRKQCRAFIEKELKDIDKLNADSKISIITNYLKDMAKKENLFTQEFKEELVGLSLNSPYTKVTNAVLKTLFNETLSNYKPTKPLWIHFGNLKNKDILYQFLNTFKWNEFWNDSQGEPHFKVDYLEKALSAMDVKLDEKPYGKDSRTKRNVAITKATLPLLKDYWINQLNEKETVGFSREILKKSSIFNGQITLVLPHEEKKCKEILEKTLLLKENEQYIFLEKISYHLKNVEGLDYALDNNLMPFESIKFIVEHFNNYSFTNNVLNLLKEKVIEHKMILNLEELVEKKTLWGDNKKFLEELVTINNYHKMEKKFEHIPENKIKKAKI